MTFSISKCFSPKKMSLLLKNILDPAKFGFRYATDCIVNIFKNARVVLWQTVNTLDSFLHCHH